jgi:hypothetical protein
MLSTAIYHPATKEPATKEPVTKEAVTKKGDFGDASIGRRGKNLPWNPKATPKQQHARGPAVEIGDAGCGKHVISIALQDGVSGHPVKTLPCQID